MSIKLSRPLFTLAVIGGLATFGACSDDEGKKSTKPGTGGAGGSAGKGGGAGIGGSAGTVAGTAGAPAGGTGGATAGTAGSTSGTAGAGVAGSAGTTAGTAGSTGSAGSAGASGSAGSSAGSAGEDAGGQGGEGGVPGCEPHPGTIYMGDASFDEPGSSAGWGLQPETGNLGGLGDGFVRRVMDEGHLCPGALEVTIPFSVYGATEKASAQKASTVDWTGKTSLHLWVKVADPGAQTIAFLNGIQVFVQSMGYAVYSSKFVSAATFDDFQWHEIVLDLTAAPAVVLTDVNQIGVQVLAAATRPPSAPMMPSETVIYVDDIYLE